MLSLHDKTAIVTGATGDIGRALARELAHQGARLGLVGRNRPLLVSTGRELGLDEDRFWVESADFTRSREVEVLAASLAARAAGVDVLVHSAALHIARPLAQTSLEDYDRMHAVNVRAPLALTQALLPGLHRSAGQIVFLNSSMGKSTRPGVGCFATTKHALRGMANGLRDEVNALGIRVLSAYLGRTAGQLQRRLHQDEGRPYRRELLLQPEDVASAILDVLCLPRTAEVTEIDIRPMRKLEPQRQPAGVELERTG